MGFLNALCSALLGWLKAPPRDDVLASYWPEGLVTGPLRLTEVEDESVDLERDIAWPIDVFSVN